MSRDGLTTSGTAMLSGANMIGLLALTAYSVRNMNEMSAYLDELRDELKALKSSYVDNTKRTHTAIARLSERVGKETKKHVAPPEPKVVEIQEEDEDVSRHVDDVTAAINDLLRR